MKVVRIYQALQNRNNDEEVLRHGPYFCSQRDEKGNLKKGIKEPWLGEGYYFWDSRIEDGKWWGSSVYGEGNYIVFSSEYDQHSPLLLDLLGDMQAIEDFKAVALYIKKEHLLSTIKFAAVLELMKRANGFHYKAVRVCPLSPTSHVSSGIYFPYNSIQRKFYVPNISKVQICFFDLTLLNAGSWQKAYPPTTMEEGRFTI